MKTQKPWSSETAGSNCDGETAHAFWNWRGRPPRRVHLNRVLESPALLNDYQLTRHPGGFSYGDDIARAGSSQPDRASSGMMRSASSSTTASQSSGICNGFQVLVKTDLLPGSLGGRARTTATLTNNRLRAIRRSLDHLRRGAKSASETRDLEALDLPVAHGEGKFVAGG